MQNKEEFLLSSNTLLASIKKYRDFINQRLEYVKSNKYDDTDTPFPSTSSNKQELNTGTKKKMTKNKFPLGKRYISKISFTHVLGPKYSAFMYIEHLSDNFMQYEDPDLQKYAKTLIPLEKLKINSIFKLRQIQKAIVKGSNYHILWIEFNFL